MRNVAADDRSSYYQNIRPEVCDLVEGRGLRVLELGCGEGRLGEELKRRGTASSVDGVELDAAAAADAQARLDRVHVADLDVAALRTLVTGPYDVVVTSDVLEHLRDPWALLGEVRALLRPGGVVVASLPNVRHLSVVLPLLLRGSFAYRDEGILDRTHLRFFTRRTMVELFTSTDFDVDLVRRRTPPGTSRGRTMALALLGDLGARQLLLRARSRPPGSAPEGSNPAEHAGSERVGDVPDELGPLPPAEPGREEHSR